MFLIKEHIVPNNISNIRLIDYCLLIFPSIPSRSGMKKAIKRGEILVNDEIVKDGFWIKPDHVIKLVDLEYNAPKPLDIRLDIIFEDEYLAIINKPPGIEVSGNKYSTIQNALISNISISNEPDALKWARPVHRLDRPTSGLLLVAKTAGALMNLGQQFENRIIKKTYLAIVAGCIPIEGEVTKKIDEQPAISSYKRISLNRSIKTSWLSLVHLYPETGRTHQLRIHMASIGYPIVGEKKYGEGPVLKGKGLFLSAIGLSFIHPNTKKNLNIKITPPTKFSSFLKKENQNWEKLYRNS